MKKIIFGSSLVLVIFCLFFLLSRKKEKKLPIKKLPIIGKPSIDHTQHHRIGDYCFTDQLGAVIVPATFDHKIYLANFFFTSCPGICLKMQQNMYKIYQLVKCYPNVKILSHSVDPVRDTVAVLYEYAKKKFNIKENNTWHFVTGDQEKIYTLAQTSYFITVKSDKLSPGGIAHGGGFILVDKQKRIRGLYDGLNTQNIPQIIKDIHLLLNEEATDDYSS